MTKYAFSLAGLAAARRLIGVLCLLILTGCATTNQNVTGGHTDNRPFENPDALRVGELVLIEFSGVGDPPERHEERIKTDGRITLPHIGAIQAAGRSRGELETAIHDAYVPNYYKNLTVIVRNEGRYFYVKGQVKTPGQFPYLKEMTVLKAIAVAGDFTDFAKKKKVLLTRGADGRKLVVNCEKALQNTALDLQVYPDDTIEVPRRRF